MPCRQSGFSAFQLDPFLCTLLFSAFERLKEELCDCEAKMEQIVDALSHFDVKKKLPRNINSGGVEREIHNKAEQEMVMRHKT